MIDISNYEVVGFEHAIRGMRNPMNSWDKIDSEYKCPYNHPTCIGCRENFCIGENDISLMKKLCKAGTDHRKFMRMIVVYADILAPMYWWKEFDTYKVGTVRNSCSTMHKITAKEFDISDFSTDHIAFGFPWDSNIVKCPYLSAADQMDSTICQLNYWRSVYLEYDQKLKLDMEIDKMLELQKLKKEAWWQLIQLLPSSYNTKATVMLNYEVLANMYYGRKDHKLDEWHEFCDWALRLPYFKKIIGIDEI